MDEEDDFKISENNINNNSNEIDFKIEEIDNNLMTSTSEFQSSLRPTKLSQRINNEEGPINLIEFSKKKFSFKRRSIKYIKKYKRRINSSINSRESKNRKKFLNEFIIKFK